MSTSPVGTGINSTAASAAATIKNPNAAMNQSDFLKLLIAQLKNQNPLSPMDGTQFTSQMAQFSSLEQLTNINTNLAGLSLVTSAINNSEAMSMIGKTVVAVGNTIGVTNGTPSPISFNLPSPSQTTNISVADSSGNVVGSFQAGPLGAGNQTVRWNGKDANGNALPDGAYTYAVNAADAGGNTINAATYLSGVVQSVSIQNGVSMLNVGNSQVSLSSVTQVGQ
ncbi:MAG: flagellar hook assembly protein FlgD [Nitrospinae bacterium]|nr:flagellar hook assembly protein FlgD [Nitrospinota bacterium]